MSHEYAGCRIIEVPYHADREYTYYIPRELSGQVTPGVFVTVPFGGGNKKKTAVVTSVSDTTTLEKCKPIAGITNRGVTLSDEMRGLCQFLTGQTLCTFGEAVRAAIPHGALSKVLESYTAAAKPDEKKLLSITPKALYVYNFIKAKGPVTGDRLRSEFGDESAVSEIVASLSRAGVITRTTGVREPTNEVTVTDVELTVDEKIARAFAGNTKIRSVRSRQIVSYLLDNGGRAEDGELKESLGPVAVQLKKLAEDGIVTLTERRILRNPFADIREDNKPLTLSPEQKTAYETLCSLYRTREAKAALLHGVTGSGKTSVIRAMIDTVTADGKSVIILVPEISLTPQTVNIFCGHYGSRVAVMHSSLSEGERVDAWHRVRSGEADIVIGTRSAVFAPTENLGMIVIDEEQEHTYKSDSQPKYTAHDVARYRCAQNNALMLLSSATPSLLSYYKAKTGAYTLVPLTERFGGASLPRVIVADMRRDREAASNSPIGSVLISEIAATLSRGEQAILFLNRRGYNNFLSCRSCGGAVLCPHCSVALTYHATRRVNATENRDDYRAEHVAAGRLECHYCGYRAPAPERCPECGGENLFYMGWGTQRVEQELASLFPSARILRMDADTTRTKSSYDEILGAFGRGEADILIGTQMVTKGHDFPSVTLVGVLLAESSLFLDDYRASERTFSIITQVIGRAGRASLPGRAVIQTYTPDNVSLSFACRQDYESFYENEIKYRRAYTFPPFCDIAQITLASSDETELSASVLRLADYIKTASGGEFSDVSILMFGPFEAPVYRVNDRFRMRVVCKCRLNRRTRGLFSDVMDSFGKGLSRRVSISIDFNPNSI